ncbi:MULTISPECIES: hypothetical protein [Catenuloplanes]|uniref:Uncharacterized protein n=1 Tax=Catenuloplanes niger TaxID=587534 RepID=A0AAE4CV98_9ACTN|nr:hypothetical protein [Catenuloplanes niger]MDR7322589.1 hypothetical protein [Catenuloplanes niger]
MATSESIDPEAAFAQLARIKLSETDLNGVLNMIADLARRAVPGADEVSVTLVRDQQARTAAFTSELALRLDETQYALGSGPCLDAAGTAGAMVLSRIATETRRPQWTSQAVELGRTVRCRWACRSRSPSPAR